MRYTHNHRSALAYLGLAAVGFGFAWLLVSPPELLKVGNAYAAKIVCSNVFIAGRDPDAVLYEDVQAPGNPLLRLIRVEVDRDHKRVTSRFLGLSAPSYALYRGSFGCTSVPDGDFEAASKAVPFAPASPTNENKAVWPKGDGVDPADGRADIVRLLSDARLAGSAMRAIIVVQDGRIIAERYGPGFSSDTPLIGWSMTKTVNAALIGRLMLSGKISFDDTHLLPQWDNDNRRGIMLSDLLAMEGGLAFNEEYGAVSDVTRMLYLEPDMVLLPADAPLAATPGTKFHYSSGTAMLLSRIWMVKTGNRRAALNFPREALFGPLGMTSAVFEADERGTFVGAAYLYATARDWARFGQFLLQDGTWNGHRLLPEGFVAKMRTPTTSSDGKYTEGQAWLAGPGDQTSAEFGLPEDTFWLEGHDGQTVAIVPSAHLVFVRMGLTPNDIGYRPQNMLKEILGSLGGTLGRASSQ
ncbi:serine hydrolase [Rhizobium sp. WYJ-E13]|uniref:serine hydrolase domain-containing protein n=1 Tax=Rhizobium sp. WYJ-E13 TaxID=2849093 RepID=UPI001C1F0C6D|nr:serine hydrolase [Rhizobium sp. WYJ-E13]QWW72442.1 beta-lactamase family protein [Rhizobium sp. WYJ-E13]